jgi:S1-C subfamily serine protease
MKLSLRTFRYAVFAWLAAVLCASSNSQPATSVPEINSWDEYNAVAPQSLYRWHGHLFRKGTPGEITQTPTPAAVSLPEIVKRTKPAIVEIVAMDEKGSPTKLGTGFFVSSDGLVVTNFHVIDGAASLAAVNNNGAIFPFKSIVAHPAGVDLAVLKFQAHDVSFLKLGESTEKLEGERVVVIGNPTGLTGTVSDGIISAFRENRSMIQITAPISPGSSGSPVLDDSGSVIGVATLISSGGQNLNFAIAVEKVSAALASLPQSSATPYQQSPTPIAQPLIGNQRMGSSEPVPQSGLPVTPTPEKAVAGPEPLLKNGPRRQAIRLNTSAGPTTLPERSS